MSIQLNIGSIRVHVSLFNILTMDDDFFIPRFGKEIGNDERIVEWSFWGTAFDSYLILEYSNIQELNDEISSDMEAIKKVIMRNKRRVIPRSEENERKIMNITCTIGGLCDDWVSKKSTK